MLILPIVETYWLCSTAPNLRRETLFSYQAVAVVVYREQRECEYRVFHVYHNQKCVKTLTNIIVYNSIQYDDPSRREITQRAASAAWYIDMRLIGTAATQYRRHVVDVVMIWARIVLSWRVFLRLLSLARVRIHGVCDGATRHIWGMRRMEAWKRTLHCCA